MTIFWRGLPDGGVEEILKKIRFSTNISLYPRSDTRQDSYYVMRLENRTQLSNGTIFNDLEW